jgi:glycosyltransferase involved in cell wall biosynthesis
LTVCFFSSSPFPCPLDSTARKKFAALGSIARVHVVGFAGSLRPRAFQDVASFVLLPWVPVAIVRFALLALLGPWLVLWSRFRHGVELVVAQSPYDGVAPALAKSILCLFGGRLDLVVESHGDFEAGIFLQRRVVSTRLYRFFMTRAARFSLGRADALRGISSATSAQLRRWAPGPPLREFMAWTDIDVFLAAGERDAPNDDGEPRVLFAGLLYPLKGVHHLLAAFAGIASAELVLAGKAQNEGYVRELEGEIARLSLTDRVRFLGEVSQEELATWMRRSAVLVLPSLSEGLGRVLVEAMATGTPVIGTRVGGIPEVVRDGETGWLVPPGDVAALRERLRWVLSHPLEAREAGRRGRETARELFSERAYVEGYRDLFRAAGAG